MWILLVSIQSNCSALISPSTSANAAFCNYSLVNEVFDGHSSVFTVPIFQDAPSALVTIANSLFTNFVFVCDSFLFNTVYLLQLNNVTINAQFNGSSGFNGLIQTSTAADASFLYLNITLNGSDSSTPFYLFSKTPVLKLSDSRIIILFNQTANYRGFAAQLTVLQLDSVEIALVMQSPCVQNFYGSIATTVLSNVFVLLNDSSGLQSYSAFCANVDGCLVVRIVQLNQTEYYINGSSTQSLLQDALGLQFITQDSSQKLRVKQANFAISQKDLLTNQTMYTGYCVEASSCTCASGNSSLQCACASVLFNGSCTTISNTTRGSCIGGYCFSCNNGFSLQQNQCFKNCDPSCENQVQQGQDCVCSCSKQVQIINGTCSEVCLSTNQTFRMGDCRDMCSNCLNGEAYYYLNMIVYTACDVNYNLTGTEPMTSCTYNGILSTSVLIGCGCAIAFIVLVVIIGVSISCSRKKQLKKWKHQATQKF